MIDLHCHILPGIDDGAGDIDVALRMARLAVEHGTRVLACTPHVFPSVYDNKGPDIIKRVAELQAILTAEGIPLRLVSGGDVHVAPDLVAKLRSGEALSLNGSRYVLVEPPHHVMPPRMAEMFFDLLSVGYVPILTHPERMSWIEREYDVIEQLFASGVWMQITGGAITGTFGRRARHWSEKMLRDGMVHIVASDGHDPERRPPILKPAFEALSELVGAEEAENLVKVRPLGILRNLSPDSLPALPERKRVYEQAEEASPWRSVVGWLKGR